MARTRDILERFRSVGTPGGASGRGVPADRTAELAAELGATLSLLADTLVECRRIRAEAVEEADRRRRAGHEHALAIDAEARVNAVSARADTAARLSRSASGKADALLAAAKEEAEVLGARASDRMDPFAERVLDRVRAVLAEPGP